MVDSKSVWMDFPGCDGFSVEVANLSRKELTSLRKRCTSQKFDRKTRTLQEDLNEDKFVVEFSKASIKNWKGLTLDHLETLILIDKGEKILMKKFRTLKRTQKYLFLTQQNLIRGSMR